MSLETWKAEFYPTPANANMGRVRVVEHSLNKWRGLSKENLNKHFLTKKDRGICGNGIQEFIWITDESCSLCKKYFNYVDADDSPDAIDEPEDTCADCPLYLARGFTSCFEMNWAYETKSPYLTWIDSGDEKSMVRWLEKTLELVKNGRIYS